MARLSRAQMQENNRAKVLAAARDEFTRRGFRDAKIDAIAERAELTRGAVYSNFPGKRALYFAVLAADAEQAARLPQPQLPQPQLPQPRVGPTPRAALAAFARIWVARLPLATDEQRGSTRLGTDLMPEVAADERSRGAFAQLMKLDAILLGLALERLGAPGTPSGRRVRVAEAVLTTLHGAAQMAAAAPGFVESFDVVSACEQLADLDLGDSWAPSFVPFAPPTRPVDQPWSPPPAVDAVRDQPARLTGDGVLAVLGLHRVAAIEEAVRATPTGAEVTVALVTGHPDELAPLARLTVAELCHGLRRAFPATAWPGLQVVLDESGSLAAAAGVTAVSDVTSTAVRIEAGRIVAHAEGWGACHSAAASGHRVPAEPADDGHHPRPGPPT